MVTVKVSHPDHVGVVRSVVAVSDVFSYHVSFEELEGAGMVASIVDIVYTYLSKVPVQFDCSDVGRVERDDVPVVFGQFLVDE